MQFLVSAWNELSQTTIVNCFKKAKISEKDQTIAINDEDDPFKEINKNLKELREKEPRLKKSTQTENDKVGETEDNEKELLAPSTRDVENSLEILKNLSLFS